MNQRLHKSIAVILLCTLTMGVKSCADQQATFAAMIETLGEAMAKLIDVVGEPSGSNQAQRLREHTATAVAILRAWKPGQSAADAIRSLNRIIDDINIIPGLDRFRPLVTLCLGTIASIIEMIGRGEPAHTPVRITQPPHDKQEFIKDWDGIRNGSPGMSEAPVL